MVLSLIIAQNGQENIMDFCKEVVEVDETKKSCQQQQDPTTIDLMEFIFSCEGFRGTPGEIREIENLIAETVNK
jgi:hypothetical protein